MGKRIILSGVTFPSTLPLLAVRPPSSGLVFGIDPDNLDLADGALVDTIPDVTGNNPAATQATGSKRPTLVYNAAGTTHKGLHFDGVDDSLTLSGTALNLARNKNALSVFVLLQREGSAAAVRDIFSLANNSGGVRVAVGSGSGAVSQMRAGTRRLDADSSTFTTQTNAAYSDSILKLSAHYEWLNGFLRLYAKSGATATNGSVALPGTAGPSSDTASSAGGIGSSGTTQYFAGTILSLLVYEAPYSAGLASDVHAFWLERYGV